MKIEIEKERNMLAVSNKELLDKLAFLGEELADFESVKQRALHRHETEENERIQKLRAHHHQQQNGKAISLVPTIHLQVNKKEHLHPPTIMTWKQESVPGATRVASPTWTLPRN